MTNDELVDALIALIGCHEEMKDSPLKITVNVTAERLIDEIRQRAIGLSVNGKETA